MCACVTSCSGEAQKEETLDSLFHGSSYLTTVKPLGLYRRLLQGANRPLLVVRRIIVLSGEMGVTPAIYQHVPHNFFTKFQLGRVNGASSKPLIQGADADPQT